jgi:hypothetical protein
MRRVEQDRQERKDDAAAVAAVVSFDNSCCGCRVMAQKRGRGKRRDR